MTAQAARRAGGRRLAQQVYSGRAFTAQDLAAIGGLMRREPTLNRAQLSRRVCELLEWRKPDGALKDMSCRVAMLRMHDDGLIALPVSRIKVKRRRAQAEATSQSDAQPAIGVPVHELPPLRLPLKTEPLASRRFYSCSPRADGMNF